MVFGNHVQYLPENHPMFHHGLSREDHPKRVPHMNPRDWLRVWVHSDPKPATGMKRLSIFYRLPYWKHLLIGHLLDPMHIFKNVGVSLWRHMMGGKDTKVARDDLKEIGVKKHLWARVNNNNGKVTHLNRTLEIFI